MKTIFLEPAGPMIQYDTADEVLHLSDLNPYWAKKWRMTPAELFMIGVRCIRASIPLIASRVLSSDKTATAAVFILAWAAAFMGGIVALRLIFGAV